MPAIDLAIATASAYPDANPDDAGLIDALRQLDLNPRLCVWNDSTVDWSAYDAVLIRTIWDYFMHYPAYLTWLEHLDHLRVPAINDTALQRWNSDKRYLLDLAGHGVDIVPTQVASRNDLRDVLDPMTGQDVVVKPTVSATAWRAVKGTVDDALHRLVAELPDGDYLVQPFVSEIAEAGEWSLLFFGGRYSHAVIKRPAAGDYRVQSDFGGITEPAVPPADVIAAAEKALTALDGVGAPSATSPKVTVYVVDWTEDKMAALGAGAVRAAERLGVDTGKPVTLIGVAALAEPDLLVEVEAIAVLD